MTKDLIMHEYAKNKGYYNWRQLVLYNTQNGNIKHLEGIIFNVNNIINVLLHSENKINQRELFYKFYN